MQIVDAPLRRRRALQIEQMPEVVQKRGGDEFVVRASLFR